MARRGILELEGQGAVGGTAGLGPQGSLAGQYAADANALDALAGGVARLADRQASAEGAAAGAAAAMEGKPTIVGRSSTYGAAYEEAAMRTYADRLDTQQFQEMFAVYQQHKEDPAALAQGLEQLKAKMLSEVVIDHPIAKATFERQFTRSALAYQQDALRAADARAKDEARAASATALAEARANLQRIAYAGGESAEALASSAEEGKRVKDIVRRGVAAGTVSATNAAAIERQVDLDRTEGHIRGQFERLAPADRPAFLARLEEDYKAGRGLLKGVDFDAFQSLTRSLEAGVRSDDAQTRAAAGALRQNVEAVRKLAADGYDVSEDQWAAVSTSAAAVPEGPQTVQALRREAAAFKALRSATPAELEAVLAQVRAQPQTTETAGSIDRTEKLLKTMREELSRDPLAWAERVGLVAVPLIDFSAGDAPARMAARTGAAEAVAERYGVPPVYLRAEELDVLRRAADTGGETMMATARLLAQGFGTRSPAVLRQVNQRAPDLAHVGGLLAAGGEPQFAADLADGLALRREPTFKAPKFKEAELTRIAGEELGFAFSASPATRLRVEHAARTAFDARTLRRGYDPTLSASDAQAAWRRTLQEAAGARFDADGNQYGGITTRDRNGWWYGGKEQVAVPGPVRADRFDDVIGALRDQDLTPEGGEGPAAVRGKPVRAVDIRSMYLVAVGDGRYQVAQEEPRGEDPHWLRTPSGRPYILDLARLEGTLRLRVPGAYFGGGR